MPRNDRLFWAYVIGFVALFAVFYPSTYAIEDEFNILSLSTAISRGTVFLDEAGNDLDADLLFNGHRISKFSPFHAALFAPAVLTNWRFAFAVTAGFAIAGAFVFRGMLRRDGLSSAWVALYFLCAGLWYYSRTLMAAVPASVMILAGASLLLRNPARPVAGGLALGIAGLFHPWMIPVAGALALGWWLDAPRRRTQPMLQLAAGTAPAVALLLFYNALTTGSPLKNVYSILGTQYVFHGENVTTFFPLYAGSLLVMPVAGWAALSRRWSHTIALPLAVGCVIVMGSLYYFRDGIGYGVAGMLPAQRFLLPASLLACLPAARLLSDWFLTLSARHGSTRPHALALRWAPSLALGCFVAGFAAVSYVHGAYLDAHHSVQKRIQTSIPEGSRVLVGDRAFKEFAPVLGTWKLLHMRDGRVPNAAELQGAYAVWIGAPGQQPPAGWFDDRTADRIEARSWIWKRDVWIAAPGPHATSHLAERNEE